MCKDPEVVDSMVGFRLRSWDLNPERAARDNPIIRGEYAQDPVQAALEFEGVRHSGQYSFLDKDEVIRAFRGSSKIKVVRDVAAGDGLVRMQATVAKSDGVSTYLHLDPAVKRDAYGLAFGHKETSPDGEPIVVIDGLVAWEPEPGIQVSITNVQSVIYEINRQRPLTKVTSDHAHSPETIQRLKANGINAESIFFSRSIQLDMYDCLRKLLHENRIIFPRMSEYTALLKDELIHLQLINANKVDHKPDKSKDLADCVAAICWQLIGNTHSEWAGSRKLGVPKAATAVFSSTVEDEFSNTRSGFKKEVLATRQRWGGFKSSGGESRFSSDSW
jgi:hypothetical protein